ncbi:hypothetical protein [Methanoculleus sp.]|uniref:hypothetical protein n=1 Tax=Methanoculleus sp. TaxID=90427 RepID=UPI002B7148B7|nr:hypothetical protein [Methanoculleus sp.]HNT09217.1 hypothetical protein [Methanoculleus sp.]
MPEEENIRIVAEKAPDYRVITIDGAYTWLNAQAGSIDFFCDVIEPEVDGEGNLSIPEVKRVFLFQIRMTRQFYESLAGYMALNQKNVEEAEKKGEM